MPANNTRRARAARRRKRRVAAVVNDLTDDQWAAIKAAWNGCAYCGKAGSALQRDCVMAISRGGRYTLVRQACYPHVASVSSVVDGDTPRGPPVHN